MVTLLVFTIFRKVVIYNLLKVWLILFYYRGETEKLEKYYWLMEIYGDFFDSEKLYCIYSIQLY